MNRHLPQPNNCSSAGVSPYQELFIYYLKGRLKTVRDYFQDNFIGNWEEDDYSFLFFSSPALPQIKTLLFRQPQLHLLDSYQMPYAEWLGENFRSFDHGRFRIIPSWEKRQPSAAPAGAKLSILLDPGLVFGTGTHPTTRDCLEAIEIAFAATPPATILDLGTGSGLLALAAAKLGSARIVAVDLNLLAAQTAAANVRRNHLEHRVVVVQAKAEEMIAAKADLVIANIHYDVMRHLIRSGGFHAKGKFILSGLLRSEAGLIAAELAGFPAHIVKRWTRDGIWHTFYGEKC
jgi:ribosomal protein L11 methyltransferase